MNFRKGNEKIAETGNYDTQNKVSSERPPIFIVGCVRSGTTLLSSMLNAHPHIVCPVETGFFLLLEQFVNTGAAGAAQFWGYYKSDRRFKGQGVDDSLVDECLRHIPNLGYKDVLDAVMHAVMVSANKSRWCEKTPGHEQFYQQIAEYYPKSPILFLIRDPRAVCCSLKNVRWGNESPYIRAKIWNKSARILQKIASSKNVHVIRYEQLVEKTEGELRKICDFIEEEFDNRMIDDRESAMSKDRARRWKSHEDEAVLSGVFNTSVDKWKDELDESEIRKIEILCADMMEYFGYVQNTSFSPLSKFSQKARLTCGFFLSASGNKIRSAWSRLLGRSASA